MQSDLDTSQVSSPPQPAFVLSSDTYPSNSAALLIDVVRDLDAAIARPATRQLDALLDAHQDTRCFVLRFTPSVFVDVRGLDVLLQGVLRARQRHCVVILLDPPRCLRRMLQVLDLNTEFTLAPGMNAGPTTA